MSDGKVVIDTRLNSTQFENDLKKINGDIKQFGTEAKASTDKATLGFNALKTAAAGFLAVFSLSQIKQTATQIGQVTEGFNDSLRSASTLFGDVAVDTENLSDKLIQLSSETQTAADSLGAGLYAALSAGIPATEDMGEAVDFLRQSAKLAKAGFAELEPTITATAAVLNAYNLSVEETERVQGIMLQTQNKGITTIAQLGTTLAHVVPTAAAFGVSFEQVGAALATMTASGTQTAQATTSLNSMLAELGKQGQQAAENLASAAKDAGLAKTSFTDLIDSGYTLSDVLLLMQDYAEKNGKSLIDMFGSVEAGRAALQLVTNDGQKFADSLEAMNDTSGLVDDAYSKVSKNIDSLRQAFTNAQIQIGRAFAPAVSSASGKLADMINTLAGNRDTAGELETALNNLKTATEQYQTAQENAKTATDDTTEAMLRQKAEAQRLAVLDYAEAYGRAMAEIEDKTKDLEKAQNVIDEMNEKLDDLASYAGMSREEMQRLYASGRLDKSIASDYEIITKEITKQEEKIKSLKGTLSGLESSYDSMVQSAVRMVSEGSISLEELQSVSVDLARDVGRLSGAYTEGTEKATAFLEATDNATVIDAVRSRLEKMRSEVSKNSGEYYVLTGQIEELSKALEKLKKTSSGSAGTQGAKEASKPSSGTEESDAGSSFVSIKDIMADVQLEIEKARLQALAFGDEIDINSATVDAYTSALDRLAELGLDETDSRVQALIDRIKELTGELKDSGFTLEDYKELLLDTFNENLVGDILGQSFSALGDVLSSTKDRVLELEKENTSMYDALAEAQEKLADAKARGDEEAIKAQEEIVKGYEDAIKANNDEIKALESGEEGWKAFGRTALEALAEVLNGLGARLAAEAVAALFNPATWGIAALATAGSAAAFAAALGLKAAAGSFADGGIVPQVAGLSTTGDQHVAFVNPGELILNASQQSNLASLLASAEAQRTLSSGGGTTVIVNMAGSTVYGLNEPAVGRAIWENIQTQIKDGVLK